MKLLLLHAITFIVIFHSTFGIHLSVRDESTKTFCLLLEANITGTLYYIDEVGAGKINNLMLNI